MISAAIRLHFDYFVNELMIDTPCLSRVSALLRVTYPPRFKSGTDGFEHYFGLWKAAVEAVNCS